MNILEILLGQVPEAIYFALFLILAKNVKINKVAFTLLCVLEYLLAFNILRYTIFSHIVFVVLVYCLLKIFYKEKCQITDIFTLGIASLLLMFTSIPIYFIVWKTVNNYLAFVIIHRIVLVIIMFLLRNKLYSIQKLYKKLWNRNDGMKKKMKSATFRSLNLVVFNVMFYIINIATLYIFFTRR